MMVTTPSGQKVELCLDAPPELKKCPIHKTWIKLSRSGRRPDESFRYCPTCWAIKDKIEQAQKPADTPKPKIMKL